MGRWLPARPACFLLVVAAAGAARPTALGHEEAHSDAIHPDQMPPLRRRKLASWGNTTDEIDFVSDKLRQIPPCTGTNKGL